jgi:hypothetical protein
MSSNINPNNLDTSFPIAGQDNDSQGFRDNFTNTKTNFEFAKDEINDLQNNVILKGPLPGVPVNNDLNGAIIKAAQLQDMRNTVVSIGTITSPTVTINVQAAPYYKMITNGDVEIVFENFAPIGTQSTVRLEIETGPGGDSITLPGEVSIGLEGVENIVGSVITPPISSVTIYEFSSSAADSEISISELTPRRQVPLQAVPAASVGAAGDKAGMVAADVSYIYVCTTDYDGIANIWVRSSAATW